MAELEISAYCALRPVWLAVNHDSDADFRLGSIAAVNVDARSVSFWR